MHGCLVVDSGSLSITGRFCGGCAMLETEIAYCLSGDKCGGGAGAP